MPSERPKRVAEILDRAYAGSGVAAVIDGQVHRDVIAIPIEDLVSIAVYISHLEDLARG